MIRQLKPNERREAILMILCKRRYDTIPNLAQEFARFAEFPYQLTVLKGSSSQKKEQLSKLHGNTLQIAVVNYESAWRLEKELLTFDADLIIADEAHKSTTRS